MPRVHHVKKARKAIPHAGIEIGDSYFWWKFRTGGRGGMKQVSKDYPTRSQLTQSEYYAAIYDLQDRMGTEFTDGDELETARDEWAEAAREIGSEQEEKKNNMPEGLQEGDTGQLLQQRAEAMEMWADEIESVEIPDKDDDEFKKDDGSFDEDAYAEAVQSAAQEIVDKDPDIE